MNIPEFSTDILILEAVYRDVQASSCGTHRLVDLGAFIPIAVFASSKDEQTRRVVIAIQHVAYANFDLPPSTKGYRFSMKSEAIEYSWSLSGLLILRGLVGCMPFL